MLIHIIQEVCTAGFEGHCGNCQVETISDTFSKPSLLHLKMKMAEVAAVSQVSREVGPIEVCWVMSVAVTGIRQFALLFLGRMCNGSEIVSELLSVWQCADGSQDSKDRIPG